MTGTVMNLQHPHGTPAAAPKLKDRPLRRVFDLFILPVLAGDKEVTGRQLFRITDNDGLRATDHRAEGVHLGGFIAA